MWMSSSAGHLHENVMASIVGSGGEALYLAAGAAYESPKYPKKAIYATIADDKITVLPICYFNRSRKKNGTLTQVRRAGVNRRIL